MAMRPSDIDIIYIDGYGFPAYKGGPMHWADSIGLDKVLADIKRFHKDYGERWRPAPLLEKLVAEGKSFADYQASCPELSCSGFFCVFGWVSFGGSGSSVNV